MIITCTKNNPYRFQLPRATYIKVAHPDAKEISRTYESYDTWKVLYECPHCKFRFTCTEVDELK